MASTAHGSVVRGRRSVVSELQGGPFLVTRVTDRPGEQCWTGYSLMRPAVGIYPPPPRSLMESPGVVRCCPALLVIDVTRDSPTSPRLYEETGHFFGDWMETWKRCYFSALSNVLQSYQMSSSLTQWAPVLPWVPVLPNELQSHQMCDWGRTVEGS